MSEQGSGIHVTCQKCGAVVYRGPLPTVNFTKCCGGERILTLDAYGPGASRVLEEWRGSRRLP